MDLQKVFQNRRFRFGCVDGTVHGEITLKPDGFIGGYSHRNENSWAIENRQLVFKDIDGNVTTYFNNCSVTGDRYILSGPFVPWGQKIWHTLTEIDSNLGIAAEKIPGYANSDLDLQCVVWPKNDITLNNILISKSKEETNWVHSQRILITAVSGSREDARAELRKYIASLSEKHAVMPTHIYRELALAAFYALDFDLFSHLLRTAYGWNAPIKIIVSQDNSSSPLINGSVFMWRTLQGGGSEFLFNTEIFRSWSYLFIVRRWIWAIRFFMDFSEYNNKCSVFSSVNVADYCFIPGFSMNSNVPGYCLIPDSEFIASDGYADYKTCLIKTMPEWRDRTPAALWRGDPFGPSRDPKKIPRVKLCELSAKPENRKILDAGLVGIPEYFKPEQRAKFSADLMRPSVRPEEMAKWKYLIDIDGTAASWAGLFRKLCTGSVVLKIMPPGYYSQWYYERLIPWENFVPIESGFDELLEKIRWLIKHDDVAERIGQKGRELALSMDYKSEFDKIKTKIAHAFEAVANNSPGLHETAVSL